MIEFIKFFIREYGLVALPIVVSIAGVLYSNYYSRKSSKKSALLAEEANKRAMEANELAKETINKNESQYIESNRPQLTAEPFLPPSTCDYYQLYKLDDNHIGASLYITVQNKGNVVASNAIIEEATFQVAYEGHRISYKRNYYDGLGNSFNTKDEVVKSNFTLIYVQPNNGYSKKLDFIINLTDTNYKSDQLLAHKSDLAITINLRLTCTYELIKGKQFITHTSHGIINQGVSILENRMGIYDIKNDKIS